MHAQVALGSEEHPVNLFLVPLVFSTGKPGVAVIVDDERTGMLIHQLALPKNTRVILITRCDMPVRLSPRGVTPILNEPYCRAISRSREEMIGRPFKHLVSADDAERVRMNRAPVKPPVFRRHDSFRAIMANGEARWQRWWDRALFDDRNR